MGISFKDPIGALNTLKEVNRQKLDLSTKLATGKRVNKAADNAAVSAIVEAFTTDINQFSQVRENVSSGISLLNTTDGATGEITNILQRQRELAVQGANGILSDQDRQAINVEFQALTEEVNRISAQTSFNGKTVLNGQGAGNGTTSISLGDVGSITLSQKDLRAESLGTSVLSLTTQSDSADAIEAIDDALATTMQTRAKVGAETNQLQSALRNVEDQLVQSHQARSTLNDLDYAQAISEKKKTDLQSKLAMKTLQSGNESLRATLETLLK